MLNTLNDPSYLISWLIAGIVVLMGMVRIIRIFVEEGAIEHIKEDWLLRLPYRLDTMKFKGLNRPAYTLICLMYYSIKAVVLLILYGTFRLCKFILWDIWVWLFATNKKEWFNNLLDNADDDEYDEDDEEEMERIQEETHTSLDEVEDLPFCQLFNIGKDMCLLVDHVEMCPDETAYIRVVDEEGYTPLYKRKVRRDDKRNRFIVFNGFHYYLNDDKTQPIISKK